MHLLATLLPILLTATRVHAVGCATHTFTQCADGITHLYDPDDGQICDPLDCGGGRAPPKSTVPCCPSYTGTLTCDSSPSYLPCFKNVAQATAMSSMSAGGSAVTSTTAAGNSAKVTPSALASNGQAASGSGATILSLPTIAPLSRGGVNATLSTGTASGVAGITGSSSSSSKPAATGNAANGLRYSPLVGIIGAAVLLV